MSPQAGYGLDEVQELVGKLEGALFPGSVGAPRHRTGIRVSDWFLPTELAWRLALSPAAAPGDFGALLGFPRGQLIRALLFRQRRPWRLRGDALAINKNYRLFYLAEKLTVKAHFPGAERDDPILHEIAFRRAAKSTERIWLPEILHHGTAGGGSYLAERIIADGARVGPNVPAEDFAEALFDFYTENGLTSRLLGEATTPEPWRAAAGRALLAAEVATSQVEKVEKAIARVFDNAAERPVLWGLCHGDLSIGNILRVDRRIFLLDWEDAHYGLVYGDLPKLCAAIPGFESRFDALTRAFSGDGAGLEAQKLLAEIALAERLRRQSEAGGKQANKLRRLKRAAQRLIAMCRT